jgi:hypothetical protein
VSFSRLLCLILLLVGVLFGALSGLVSTAAPVVPDALGEPIEAYAALGVDAPEADSESGSSVEIDDDDEETPDRPDEPPVANRSAMSSAPMRAPDASLFDRLAEGPSSPPPRG